MGRLDDEQIASATDAFVNGDEPLARRVTLTDDQIDALQQEIEEKAVTVIARRQPMGSDLREVVGALRNSNELERVGDLAENIAKRVVLLAEEVKIAEAMVQLQRMVQLVREQLTSVLESYARRDVAAAMLVWRKDQEVDALNTALFRDMLTYMMENPCNITFCTHLLFCAKNIERIGDHTTNIAETVVYMVEGRPLAAERPKADLTSKVALPLSA